MAMFKLSGSVLWLIGQFLWPLYGLGKRCVSFAGGICQLWGNSGGTSKFQRLKWMVGIGEISGLRRKHGSRLYHGKTNTCLLAEGPWDSKGWVSEAFILRIFIFQLREFQVHVCLFSRRDWVNLFWMRGMAPGTVSACAWPKSISLDINYPCPQPPDPIPKKWRISKIVKERASCSSCFRTPLQNRKQGRLFPGEESCLLP